MTIDQCTREDVEACHSLKTSKTSFLMTIDQCTREDVEACHTAFPASASFPRWQYIRLQSTTVNRQFFNLTNNMPTLVLTSGIVLLVPAIVLVLKRLYNRSAHLSVCTVQLFMRKYV